MGAQSDIIDFYFSAGNVFVSDCTVFMSIFIFEMNCISSDGGQMFDLI